MATYAAKAKSVKDSVACNRPLNDEWLFSCVQSPPLLFGTGRNEVPKGKVGGYSYTEVSPHFKTLSFEGVRRFALALALALALSIRHPS